MEYQYIFDAIYNNNLEFLKNLLNEEIILDARDIHGCNLLHAVIHINRPDILNHLLTSYPALVNSRCTQGRTPFFHACESDTVDFTILKTLIKHGADINIPNNEGVTALHTSCQNGNSALTKLLLNNGAEVTTNENNGCTVLHYIALSNCVCSLQILKNYRRYSFNTEINFQDFDGSTALMIAVDVGNLEIAKEFLKNGANCNIIARDTTAVHLSIITGQTEIFELLWQKVNFNICIELATRNNLVKLLIKYGWFLPERINHFFQVLDHPRILEILGEDTKILTVFFYQIRFVKNIHDIDIIKLVKKFLSIGVKVSQNDLRVFILNFYRFKNGFDILNTLVKDGSFNIDDKNIIKFIIELYPKLVPQILPFCIKNGPLDIINCLTEILRINKGMIKLVILMLHYCTPGFSLKRILQNHLTNFCLDVINFEDTDDEILILYIINNLQCRSVPSLKELSRDVFRGYMARFCKNSNDFLLIVSKLELSEDIINTIQCTWPVNILNDF